MHTLHSEGCRVASVSKSLGVYEEDRSDMNCNGEEKYGSLMENQHDVDHLLELFISCA
jgi:hypothetical protein